MNTMKHKYKIFATIILITVFIFGITCLTQTTSPPANNYIGNSTEHFTPITDTSAPVVKLSNRYLFTNDITQISLDNLLTEDSDSTEWSARLIRFKKYSPLEILNETTLKNLVETIPLPAYTPELEQLGTQTIPTEEGIYRAVMEISDIHGNYTLEEIFVIYDTTGAYIEDTPDKTITVKKENLNQEPIIDKNDYIITDNVDGKISSENIMCTLELRDEKKHEWLVHVSYTDRAGNESKSDFLIIVKEKTSETINANENKNNDTKEETKPPLIENTSPYSNESLSPNQQKVVNAGFGMVVKLDSDYYAVLTHGDGCVDGKTGGELLREHLAEKGLIPQNVSGGWIDPDNDWYCWIAQKLISLDSPDTKEFEN